MKKRWLERQIKKAQTEMATWPQWMRDATKMDGAVQHPAQNPAQAQRTDSENDA